MFVQLTLYFLPMDTGLATDMVTCGVDRTDNGVDRQLDVTDDSDGNLSDSDSDREWAEDRPSPGAARA